ncbi:hypothetical protein BDZ97DRAFT_1912877 [Flammula alnicola]|nr:hypothetical protein BDZ97DRAFT_1912877 [Flammula alnicola]
MAPIAFHRTKAIVDFSSNRLDAYPTETVLLQFARQWDIATSTAISARGSTGSLDTISTQYIPFASETPLHAPLRPAIVISSDSDPSGAVNPASEIRHLNPPTIVCITLAFVSILLGLAIGAMTLSKTSWYRSKRTNPRAILTVFSWRRTNGNKPADADHSRPGHLKHNRILDSESKKTPLGFLLDEREFTSSNNPSVRKDAMNTSQSPEIQESPFRSRFSDQTETSLQDIQQSDTIPGPTDSDISEFQWRKTPGSEASDSSEQTMGSDEAERLSSGSSTKTSMTSIVYSDEVGGEEADLEEEVAQVHRAQTQSVEIKRAVLIAIPARM